MTSAAPTDAPPGAHPPPGHATAVLPYASPTAADTPGGFPTRLEWSLLRVGHWTGSLAVLLLAAGTGLLVADKAAPASGLLPWAFGSADVGLLSAFTAAWLGRRRGHDARGAVHTAIFNSVIYVAALSLFAASRGLAVAL